MRALVVALALALFAAPAALANGGTETAWLADANVLAMSSVTLDNVRLRALVVANGDGQSLVIESFDRYSGQMTSQRWASGFDTGGYSYDFAQSATGFDNITFQGTRLGFMLYTRESQRATRCTVDAFDAQLFAHCDDSGYRPRPQRPRPQPVQTNWAAAPHIIAACDAAMYGNDKQLACLDAASVAVLDPAPAIAACDAAMYGDDNTLACLQRVVRARIDVVPAIVACDSAMYGDESTLSCLDHASLFRYPPAATIAACDAATYGDPSTIACVQAASRYASDATATIQACDAATYGDDQTIACIERGGSY